jgi:hypothetical protein
MGGVSSTLLGYWCRGGCSTATVAAALTFFPPESTYDVVENPSTGETEWRIDPIFEPIPFDGTFPSRRKRMRLIVWTYCFRLIWKT